MNPVTRVALSVSGALIAVGALSACGEPPVGLETGATPPAEFGKKPGPGSGGYQLVILDRLPGGGENRALAVNDEGGVVGWSSASSGGRHAVFWPTGSGSLTPQALPDGGMGSWSEGLAINASGQVGGNVGFQAVIWERSGSGPWSVRALPGGTLRSLNDVGEAAGHSGFDAVVWDAAGTIEVLPLPEPYAAADAYGRSDAAACGSMDTWPNSGGVAVLWVASGSGWDVLTLSGGDRAHAVSNAVSRGGNQVLYVVGTGGTPSTGRRAFRWTVTYDAFSGRWLETSRDDLGLGLGYAVNDAGDAAGLSGGRAALWKASGETVLLPGSKHNSIAFGMDGTGRVVGHNIQSATNRAALWRPTS